LIPVGSDAWLGLNQWPKEGSIVLVHANGNEPIGIHRFLELMHKERENIVHKHWLLFDLRESLIGYEQEKKEPDTSTHPELCWVRYMSDTLGYDRCRYVSKGNNNLWGYHSWFGVYPIPGSPGDHL
jgi:hypothetical protein